MNLTIGKKFLILAVSLSLITVLSFGYNYFTLKEKITQEFESGNERDIEYVLAGLQEALMASDHMSIFNILRGVISTTNIEHIKITYNSFVFTKSALIYNSTFPKNLDWEVSDISTDARNGFISLESNNMYKLYTTALFNPQRAVNVKFILYKDGALVNAQSRLNFYYELSRNDIDTTKIDDPKFVQTKDIYFVDEPFAKMSYVIDDTVVENRLSNFYKSFWIYFIVLLIGINAVLGAIYYLFVLKLLLRPIKLFASNMQNALDNNFANKINYKSGNADFDNIIELLNKLLKKYTSVVNELNINKDILERKVFTDDLTGLQNQKVFELDLKNMFITRADGFIGYIKIEALGAFTKQFGSALANHLIEEFTHTVQNKFYEFELQEATLYRFFGSEFAMIIKNKDEEIISSFASNLMDELQDMAFRYEVSDTLSKFTFVPFDKYGTIDSILHSLSDSYNKLSATGEIFSIVSSSEVVDKFAVLEQSVRAIIDQQSFDISYGFDTYLIETDEIMMQDAIPLLFDENGEKFPIGVFISAAEKIGLASKFDKYILENVIFYINSNEIQHKIAVNLSMFSLEDSEFVTWLHSILLYNEDAAKHLVFSMTSYNASTKVEVFKHFVDEVHRFGAKVIMKRYTMNDFNLEDLEMFRLDYLRVHKDYTNGIAEDRDKKHLLRSLLNFCEANNIIAIGDSIKSQNDLKVCKLMGLDAVSKF
jgi:EAL domain-containing protein (putative c-di-GMP-specific phosphodiesterase class I)/GGDEF domain-containing protein